MTDKLGWDSPIGPGEKKPEFKLIPANTVVEFEITGFEKATTANGNPCAKLTLACLTEEGDQFNLTEEIVLTPKAQWKAHDLFVSIGQIKPDQAAVPNWNKVVGSTGRCRIGVRDWKGRNGDTMHSNEVAKFLPADT